MGPMNAIHILFASIFGLGLVCGASMMAANKLLSGMVDDELRTRVDRLAGVFVNLALRRLPADQREFYRPDWDGVLLAGLYDETAGLPVTRLFKSIRFGLSLWLGAGRIRKETKPIRQVARGSGRVQASTLVQAEVTASAEIVFRDEDGTYYREVEGGYYQADGGRDAATRFYRVMQDGSLIPVYVKPPHGPNYVL
jgi:hypothetical protein